MTRRDEGRPPAAVPVRRAPVAGFRRSDPGYFGQMTKVTHVAELGVDP